MPNDFLSLSGTFPDADESQWAEAVSKALRGASPDRLSRTTADGLTIKPLYREADWPSATDPLGHPGLAPFLRAPEVEPNKFLPWDIRQIFAHPDPATTQAEIMRDLERGVSSIELAIDPEGIQGCAIGSADDMATALSGVDASIAAIALAPAGAAAGYGLGAASLLANWAKAHAAPATAKLAFNLCPLAALSRLGTLEESLDSAFARAAFLVNSLQPDFAQASFFRIDATALHDAGGTDAQELGGLIAQGIDTLRRLGAAGLPTKDVAPKLVFTLSVGPNYGVEIARLRAARRLWARCLEALDLPAVPMNIQAVSARRMLTKRDPWVNLLRNTAACFAAGVGGADIVTLRAFTDALGVAEELGRRTARNTQIIAQEESQLGRIADPAGGAWFIESHANDLAKAAWSVFQDIEADGGFGASLLNDALQPKIADARKALQSSVARRKTPITGVSEFPLLEEIQAPIADVSGFGSAPHISAELPESCPAPDGEALASPLWPIRLSEPFERLRDHADTQTAKTGTRPSIFLATLGSLASHTARADYARNLFATGGIEAKNAPVPPEDTAELVAAFRASGCALAVLCGSDTTYAEQAEAAAKALKDAGVQRLYLAGKPGDKQAAYTAAGLDSFIHIGADIIATLELAHAELGIT
ncbi:MAG: methylmalonyl-CoA mutase family protein [Hyphomonadaceae bacterium]